MNDLIPELKSPVSNRQIAILIGIRDRKSIKEMAEYLGVSTGTIHHELRNLERLEIIDPPPKARQARMRLLTGLGRRVLLQWTGEQAEKEAETKTS